MMNDRKTVETEISWLEKENADLRDRLSKLESDIQFQEEIIDLLRGIVEEIDMYFSSGNEIPVDRATIMRKDWLTILQNYGNIV